MRAGKLVYGFDTLKENIKLNNVFLVFTASDLSPKTVKEVKFFANKDNLPHLPLSKTMEEIEGIIGKKTGIIGITDRGFAEKLSLIYNETEDITI